MQGIRENLTDEALQAFISGLKLELPSQIAAIERLNGTIAKELSVCQHTHSDHQECTILKGWKWQDIFSGFVPVDIVEKTKHLGIKKGASQQMVYKMCEALVTEARNKLWIPRCDATIQHENTLGITKKQKYQQKSRMQRTGLSGQRRQGPKKRDLEMSGLCGECGEYNALHEGENGIGICNARKLAIRSANRRMIAFLLGRGTLHPLDRRLHASVVKQLDEERVEP